MQQKVRIVSSLFVAALVALPASAFAARDYQYQRSARGGPGAYDAQVSDRTIQRYTPGPRGSRSQMTPERSCRGSRGGPSGPRTERDARNERERRPERRGEAPRREAREARGYPMPMPEPSRPPRREQAPAPGPSASVRAGDFEAQVEDLVLELTNAERTSRGLPPLNPSRALSDIARNHSEDMLEDGYFGHEDPRGCDPSCRFERGGYDFRASGENIYSMSGHQLGAEETAQRVVNGWMQSPGHRANILSDDFSEMGTGIARNGSSVYATSNYGTPR